MLRSGYRHCWIMHMLTHDEIEGYNELGYLVLESFFPTNTATIH